MAYRIIILLFCSHLTFGQIPQDFEFLYHDNQSSTLGAKHLTDDGVLFVSHNSAGDMTVVAFAKNDNTQEILFTSNFSTRSKKVITQDSAIHFLLYNIFDYDVGLPGFYDVIYHNGEVEVRSYSFKDSSEIEDKYVDHVSIDAQGNYVIEGSNKKLITFDGVSILDEVELDFQISAIYKSNDQKIYVQSSDKVFLFENNQLFEVLATEKIKDIQILGSYNAVLLDGQIDLYDDSFNLTNTFVINTGIKELRQVSFVDSTMYTVEKNSEELTILTIEWNGNSNEDVVQSNGNESITTIKYLSPNNFLVYGHSNVTSFQGFSALRNIFFRNVDVTNGNSYEKTDVQILNYELIQTGKDSFANYIDDVTNDTVWWVSYFYDINFTFLNNNDDPVLAASVFHTVLFNNFGPTSLKLYNLETSLDSNDKLELNFSGESFGSFERLKNLQIVLPGANHKFNIAENILELPQFQSDVTTVEFSNSFQLFPNPASDVLNITTEIPIKSYEIYNSSGQLALARKGITKVDRVDVSNLQSGIYFLRHKHGTSQFIKQ